MDAMTLLMLPPLSGVTRGDPTRDADSSLPRDGTDSRYGDCDGGAVVPVVVGSGDGVGVTDVAGGSGADGAGADSLGLGGLLDGASGELVGGVLGELLAGVSGELLA